MIEGVGKISFASRSKTAILYIPSDITKDSAFPFENGENVRIRIENQKLIVEKASYF